MKPRYLLLFIVNFLAYNQGILMRDAKFLILPSTDYPGRSEMEYGIWNAMESALLEIIGVFLFGYLAHRFGRKKSIISLGMISHLFQIMYLADLPEGVVDKAFKFVNSASLVISTIYIGEAAEDRNRGAFVSSYILSNRFGQHIHSIARFRLFSLHYLLLANTLLSFIFVAAAFRLPETPLYLLQNNRTEDAKKALRLLQGNSNIDEGEFQDLVDSVEKSNSSKRTIMSFITNPATRAALIIGSVTMILNRLLYTNVVLFGQYTLQKTLTHLWHYDKQVIYKTFLVFSFGLFLEICGVILTVLLVDRCGRKFLLLVSYAGMAFIYGFIDIIAIFEEFPTEESWKENYFPWLNPTIFVILYVIHDVGCGTVPYILLSELFQTHARVSGIIFCYLFYCPLTYLLQETYMLIRMPLYLEIIRVAFFFTVYFGGFLFAHYCIPETKGKSLQDISEVLNRQE